MRKWTNTIILALWAAGLVLVAVTLVVVRLRLDQIAERLV